MKTKTGRFATLVLLPLLLALAACDSPAPKLPHVRMETVSHPVVFAEGATQMYPAEVDSLAEFSGAIHPTAVSRIVLAADDTNAGAVARARNVRNYLVKQGFDKNVIRLVPTKDIDPRTVVLSIEYAKGIPPAPCPDWSKNAAIDYTGSGGSNFGCAYNSDMIVQIANPADYNGGNSKPASDGARESVYIQRYMSGAASSVASGGSSSSGGGSTTTTSSSP